MGHACEWETSMMLRLAPHLVGDYRNAADVPWGRASAPGQRAWITKSAPSRGISAIRNLRPRTRASCCSAPFAADVVAFLNESPRGTEKHGIIERRAGSGLWRCSVCGLLLLATMLNYMDRLTLA